MIDWNEVTDERLLRHFRNERLDPDMIGARYGVEEEIVASRLEALGEDAGKRIPRTSALHAMSDASFHAALLDGGAASLARKLGVDRQTVQRRQHRLGIVLPRGRRLADGRYRGGEKMSDGDG